MKKFVLFVLILLITLSEILLKLNSTLGFLMYAFFMTGSLFALSKQEKDEISDTEKLIYIFLIFPIIRISELFNIADSFWKILIVYYIIFFISFFYSMKFKIDVGYKKKGFILFPLILILSLFLGYIGNLYLETEKIRNIFFLIPLISLSEELFFRGLIQNSIEKISSPVPSILLTSLLYFIFTISLGISTALFLLFVSLIISLIYNFNKNIFIVFIINLIIQIFLFV